MSALQLTFGEFEDQPLFYFFRRETKFQILLKGLCNILIALSDRFDALFSDNAFMKIP